MAIRIVRIKRKEPICEDPKTCSTRKHVGGGNYICIHHNLATQFPHLAKEWHECNEKSPEEYSCASNKKVWWKCGNVDTCECHIWETKIYSRTGNKSACPYCNINKICEHNNLAWKYPDLVKEWHECNEKRPEDYSYGSEEKVWWKCSEGHSWETKIKTRTGNKNGCPTCRPSGYSKISIDWLNSIMEKENINIQHAENGGEFYIQGVGKVDGYCKDNNTVYEFHGSYWHGNSKDTDLLGYHPVSGIRNIELFLKTLLRDRKIQEAGYNLVSMWEHRYIPSK